MISRRSFLSGFGLFGSLFFYPLSVLAEKNHGDFFVGVSVSSNELVNDVNYKRTILADYSVVTPEWELKWGEVERQPGRFDFLGVEKILNELPDYFELRGHVLTWSRNIPKWVESVYERDSFRFYHERYIKKCLSYFGDKVVQWDVVNEAIKPEDGNSDGFRSSLFLDRLGFGYVENAFRYAHECSPSSRLYYNEFGLWAKSSSHEKKRYFVLKLLDRLVSAGVPINGLGLQSHLSVNNFEFDQKVLDGFVNELSMLGLEITITEFDVSAASINGDDTVEMDSEVASLARDYLDVLLPKKNLRGIVIWGVADQHSFLNKRNIGFFDGMRVDGKLNRCLPYSYDYKRKKLWIEIKDAIVRSGRGSAGGGFSNRF